MNIWTKQQIKAIKANFKILKNQPDLIYLDSAATSLTPNFVVNECNNYYNNYNTNPHNLNSILSYRTNQVIINTRIKVKNFINANDYHNIAFGSNSTYWSNQIAYSLEKYISKDNNIFLDYLDHISNIGPWLRVSSNTKCKINKIKLQENFKIDYLDLVKRIDKQTKVVVLSAMNNITGSYNNIYKICDLIKQKNSNILIVIDCAQIITHHKINIQKLNADFIFFSSHKMLGPTGLGIMWFNPKIKSIISPMIVGGGAIATITNSKINFYDYPNCLEAGTANVAAIFGLNAAINYINKIGIDNINAYLYQLKQYFNQQYELKLKNKIIYYNKNNETPFILFNIKDKHPHDVGSYLSEKHNIIVRVGDMCSKFLIKYLGTKTAIRVSLYIYNTKSDIDTLINALIKNNDYIGDWYDK